MCADTLITRGYISANQTKMVGYRLHDGAVIFGYSGSLEMADAAVQSCERSFRDNRSMRSKDDLADIIKGVLSREYKTHIIENGYQNSDYDYSIIAAIYSETDGLDLYHSSRTQFKRCRHAYECIGTGEIVAKLAIRQTSYGVFENAEHAALVAAYAMARAKKHARDSVGGNSILIHLQSDGLAKAVRYMDIAPIGELFERFELECSYLFSALFDAKDYATFDDVSKGLVRKLKEIRKVYIAKRKRLESSMEPPEATQLVKDLNTSEFMARWQARREARQDLSV
jgi:hypothetical protein